MKIKKTASGYKISFDCPECKLGLVAKLEEAGSIDQCPDCSTRFKVPGEKQLQAMRSREAESKAQREEERRIKAEEKSIQKAERKAEKEQARKQTGEPAYELAEQKKVEETNSEGVEREASAHLSKRGIADSSADVVDDKSPNPDPDPFAKVMSMYPTATPDNSLSTAASIKCQQCGSLMFEQTKVINDMTVQLLGVVLFIVGLGIIVGLIGMFPISTILGACLMIVAARIGHSKKKIWACNNCGYFFERL